MPSTANTTLVAPPWTLTYKRIKDLAVSLDVYPPLFARKRLPRDRTPIVTTTVPAVIYFHGGGLTVGNKTSWFPTWLYQRLTTAGYAFISVDYRLMPPSTAHDVLTDIKDAFHYVSHELNTALMLSSHSQYAQFRIDPNAIAVAGTSAGGLCAYLAAMHVSPMPKAVVSLYGMGGDVLTHHFLTPKTEPFFKGREVLNPADFAQLVYPFSPAPPKPTSDSPLSYLPPSSSTPGYPANPRMQAGRLYLQLGTVIDYLTGQHEPSLSAELRASLGTDKLDLSNPAGTDENDKVDARLKEIIPESHRLLFPQLNVTNNWPPVFMAHGALDTAVPVYESRHINRLLEEAGVDATLVVVEGAEHSFDYEPDAEEKYGTGLFDDIARFLSYYLENA